MVVKAVVELGFRALPQESNSTRIQGQEMSTNETIAEMLENRKSVRLIACGSDMFKISGKSAREILKEAKRLEEENIAWEKLVASLTANFPDVKNFMNKLSRKLQGKK